MAYFQQTIFLHIFKRLSSTNCTWSIYEYLTQMKLGDPTDLVTEKIMRAVICTSRLYVWLRNYRFLTCLYAGIPSTLDFGNYRQNWSKQEINGKRVMKVIWVIERILLLPWIQWAIIQVIGKCETNGDFF